MSNVGTGGNSFSTPADQQAAYDRLPETLRKWVCQCSLELDTVAIENRLVVAHKGNVSAFLDEAEWIIPQFRDKATGDTWGKDHPSIGGPLLEEDFKHGPIRRRSTRFSR